MIDPLDHPGPVAVGGGVAAFGAVLAAHVTGVVSNVGTMAAVFAGSSFGLTVGLGLFVTLVAMAGAD